MAPVSQSVPARAVPCAARPWLSCPPGETRWRLQPCVLDPVVPARRMCVGLFAGTSWPYTGPHEQAPWWRSAAMTPRPSNHVSHHPGSRWPCRGGRRAGRRPTGGGRSRIRHESGRGRPQPQIRRTRRGSGTSARCDNRRLSHRPKPGPWPIQGPAFDSDLITQRTGLQVLSPLRVHLVGALRRRSGGSDQVFPVSMPSVDPRSPIGVAVVEVGAGYLADGGAVGPHHEYVS
jgi:hypothetical protein